MNDNKDVLKVTLQHRIDDYRALENQFNLEIERGFSDESVRIECRLITILSEMIRLKDEIRNLETTILYGQEEE